MTDHTKIEWADATWNPVTGCDEVSPGCDHCYAKTFAERFRGVPGHYFEDGFDVQLRPDKLDLPLRWTKPRRVFVNSMSDLFHKDIPDEYIARVFAVMAIARAHTFQVLTKRHGRMRSLLSSLRFWIQVETLAYLMACGEDDDVDGGRALQVREAQRLPDGSIPQVWPLPNVWLGVSVEDQQRADLRIPALLDTPAAVRFLSCEPLLGRVDLLEAINQEPLAAYQFRPGGIDWVIVGGESGHGARPMHPDWARSLRDQCTKAGVPFHFKQRGEWTWIEPDRFRIPTKPYSDRVAVMHPAGMTAMTKRNPFNPFERGHPDWHTRIERVGKLRAGRELDGRTWDEFPEAVAR
ncbi:DUF5131 family protein [Nocardioides speluncae]|uniref:DUF5131 family protein n=1 Tax=Nocardioides speluncae TaxID=2670337 RepID=UPI000D68AE36|nr:phage Gp37/Gp68 family protein [Nocardioides speluncae]